MSCYLIMIMAFAIGNGNDVVEESQCGLDRDGESLHCFLRTLQSPIGPDGSDVNRVQRLRLKCADNFFLESKLKTDHFGHLSQLEELHIKFCKLRHLPAAAFSGLTNLKKLVIQSHNADWSSILMELDKDTFQKMSNLRMLDMSFNNLWSLPGGSLCDMTSMKKINLSHNHLLDVVDVGLSYVEGCQLPEVRVVDLSHNHISSLQKGDLRQVSGSLEILDLHANRLNILADDALHSMTSLLELNLADNQLAAVPPTLFSSSGMTIKTLHLQNNSLTLLTPELFVGLGQLVMLNLSHNAIFSQHLTIDTFKGLASLSVLDLSFNRLTQLEANIFSRLISLQALDVSHNQIHMVNGLGLASTLTMISMSHNVINSIAENTFKGLKDMTSLSLDHNKIRYVPDSLLGSLINLEDLSFNGNDLAEVPLTLQHLSNLRTLDLGENAITELKPHDFNSLTKLYGLRLAGNKLSTLDKIHLVNVTGIHVLNLAHNELVNITGGAFDNLKELRALRLDNNMLSDINGLVSSLSKLQWFNVSTNKLLWFDYAFVPKSLEWLDIQNNEIEELGNYYKLKSGFSLKRLDASGNLIRSLSKLSLPTSLEHLSLNKNAIRHIESGVFEDKPNLHRVELVDNEINHLKLSALSVGRVSPKGTYLQFFSIYVYVSVISDF
jgi:Leucine-rich repeat (LRR) protein